MALNHSSLLRGVLSDHYLLLRPGGGCEVLFSPCLSVCLSVCVCVSGQYYGILFLGYLKRYRSEIDTGYLYGTQFTKKE